jgi:1-hydroxy-2-naphthoate dioxygenase
MSEVGIKNVKSLPEFDKDLAAMHMRGQWQYDSLLERVIGGPPPAGKPHIWHWKAVYEKLLEACDVMPESLTARRNFSFLNPGIERGGTTQTLLMGMQIVKPGEVAWAHRHTIGALRLVIRLDVLDVPLVMGLNQAFYEPFGQSTQPLREGTAESISERASLVRPVWERQKTKNFPFRYAWKDILPHLEKMAGAEGTPYDGVVLEYVNPITGGSALPTMGVWLHHLKAGFEGKQHRRTSSAVYYVIEGEGTLLAGDQEIQWGPRDAFVVPNWMNHRILNRSKSNRAILFAVNDIPLLEPLGLYREDPESTLRVAAPPTVPGERPGVRKRV